MEMIANSSSASPAPVEESEDSSSPSLTVEQALQEDANLLSETFDDVPSSPSNTNSRSPNTDLDSSYWTTTAINNSIDAPLAVASSTPSWARVLLPLMCVMTHALFYYGQTAPMWKLRGFADIDVWANATDHKTRLFFDTIGWDYDNHFTYQQDKDVQTFTYYFAIEHLWEAKGLPGLFIPRLAAVLLIVFSGIWPHLKLVWLQLTWFFSKGGVGPSSGRSTTLRWLSTLGKWSLADVLVVCVMVGVLHLDWVVEPDAIKGGVISDLPALMKIVKSQYTSIELCDKLLKMTCAKQPTINKIKCKACQTAVSNVFAHPKWARSTGVTILNGVHTNGGGVATLRVVGMRGIYAFCGAVIVSILLSLVVDIFDHRAKQQVLQEEQHAIGQRRLHRVIQRQQQQQQQEEDEADTLQEPLLLQNSGASPLEVDLGGDDTPTPSTRAKLFSCKFIIITLITNIFVFLAVDWDTMERQVYGAGPELLHEILGVDWKRSYSLRSLMFTTGAAGGWDYLLMGTFALFCVLGPAIRAVLLVVVAGLDRCKLTSGAVGPLSMLINWIGAFCSWEVFAIAIVMVQMLMPSITNTIINSPVCGQISDDGSCLQVEFNVLPVPFSSIVIGGFLLVATSWIAVRRGVADEGTTTAIANSRAAATSSNLAGVMTANHDYQRLQGVGERTSETIADDGLQELVFETNQV